MYSLGKLGCFAVDATCYNGDLEIVVFGGEGISAVYVNVYVPASYIMYLSDFCRFLLCTVPVSGRGGGRGGLEKGRGLEREG